MKKIFTALLTTVSAVVLVFSYHTSLQGAEAPQAVAASGGASAPGASGTGSAGSGSAGTGSAGTGTSAGSAEGSGSGSSGSNGALVDGVYTGAATPTRYGTVQVQVTVQGGRISDVSVPQYPQGGGRTQAINSRAIPQLVAETTSAQSATIDMVSGATYTSDGYLASLQSALDQARS